MLETGEAVLALLPFHLPTHPDASLMAALLHDIAKADEYQLVQNRYRLTDNSILNGHKHTIGDWVAVAENRMRLKVLREYCMSLRHALGAETGLGATSGYRPPRTPVARLLALADQCSGSGNLYFQTSDPDGGWGMLHPHLGKRVPYSLPRKPQNGAGEVKRDRPDQVPQKVAQRKTEQVPSRIIHPMLNSFPPPRDPILARLVATYPVFRDIQPLDICIHKAIIAAHPDVDKAALRRTLQRHTASTRYLKAIAAGGSRFGLDGVPTGNITPEQQKQANQDLKDRFRKMAEQRREQLKALEHQARLQEFVDKFRQK